MNGPGRRLYFPLVLLTVACPSVPEPAGTVPEGADPSPAGETRPAAETAHRWDERKDPTWFVGEYGTPEMERRGRTFWVLPRCGGGLVAGASWGDASPWVMEQVSEGVFVQRLASQARDVVAPVRLEFLATKGEETGLRVLYGGEPFLPGNPLLKRLRDRPEGFEDECVRRH